MKEDKRLGQLLLKKKILDETTLKNCLSVVQKEGKRLGEVALEKKLLNEDQLIDILSDQLNIETVALSSVQIPDELFSLLPLQYCQKNLIVPYQQDASHLYIAMADPLNIQILDDLSIKFSKNIVAHICKLSDLQKCLSIKQNTSLEDGASSVEDLVKDINKDMSDLISIDSNIEELTNDAPIIKLVDWIFDEAIGKKVSDIHIERYENKAFIRYRIDGILYDMDAPPENIFTIIVSRIKLISGMNIAENRLPQDGRITHTFRGKKIDLRVSTIPSIHGEGVVIRILDHNQDLLDINKIGLSKTNITLLKKSISVPNGIVLITGPTGSGKTTALYASLSYVKSEKKKIITLEDPVEYKLDRINQLNVNASIGFSFASALRHILRQDPDIIMVGEIRDNETATVSMRAALTGHLVLSTLHTNNAISTIVRLLDMQIEPYLIASTLVTVVAQRLLRTLCEHCKIAKIISEKEFDSVEGLKKTFHNQRHVYQSEGCDRCMNSGYRGRTGIYEVLPIDRDLKHLIINQASSVEITEFVKKKGLVFLIDNGFEKVREGITTIDEVLRVTQKEVDEE